MSKNAQSDTVKSSPTQKSSKSIMLILMLVMVVNSLSYGTIIPLLYPYATKFGLGPGLLSLLVASYSLFQFFATPIIGRLSDRYGRKPLLVVCLAGTAASLALFALAQSMAMLFVARILDGITGGNNSVAQAVVADTNKPADRAKAFGLLGAASGFGFVAGPALGGLLSQIGMTTPFWVAAGIALLGTVLAMLLLPETLQRKTELIAQAQPMFDFKRLWHALWAPGTGVLLLISLAMAIGMNSFIMGFQTTTNVVLRFTPFQIGLLFTVFGLVNVFMLAVGLRLLLKITSNQFLLTISLSLSIVLVGLLGFATTPVVFVVLLCLFMFVPPAFPLLTSLLSQATKPAEQGSMLGLNQAYASIGQVIGPLLAGLVAQWYAPGAFWIATGVWGVGLVLTKKIPKVGRAEKV